MQVIVMSTLPRYWDHRLPAFVREREGDFRTDGKTLSVISSGMEQPRIVCDSRLVLSMRRR